MRIRTINEMTREREAGGPSPGSPPLPDFSWYRPVSGLPWALLAAAVLVALSVGRHAWASWLNAAALLLMTAAAAATGALWSRQRQLDRLREARMSAQLLGQMIDTWQWQTDAEHRLIRLQPPQGAPASSWVAGTFSGELLWQRFDNPEYGLQARLQARMPVHDAPLMHAGQAWCLRGLPRFDGRGRFAGYQGTAWPTAQADQQRTAQQGFEALMLRSPGAVCLALPDPEAGGWRLARANPAACALLGLTNPPDGSQSWASALAGLPDGLRQGVTTLTAGHGFEGEGWEAWLDPIHPSMTMPVAQPSALLLSMAPRPAADHAAGTDITAAHQAAAAEHAAFSYTVSHDLRAPIRVIEGFGRILKEDYSASLDRVGHDHLDRMMSAAARMNHMMDALLSVSKLSTQPLAQQPVNLSQLALWVMDDLRRTHPERSVSVHLAPDLCAHGDPTLLRMALENLLGNAWKYSARTMQAEIRFEQIELAGRLVYRVQDNGAGFDMRFADRLFGVFQRLHSSSEFSGHGVGLASVQRIVRRHGGEVWAEGEVGRGASFYFTLKA